MDTGTGHLISDEEYQKLDKERQDNYEQVPERLSLSAQLELMGRAETIVGKKATSQIATWARSKRDRLKIKAKKRKMNKYHCQ